MQVRVDVGTYKMLGIRLMLGNSHMSQRTPSLELFCDTGAQVDCISSKKLRMMGLGEDQLRKHPV